MLLYKTQINHVDTGMPIATLEVEANNAGGYQNLTDGWLQDHPLCALDPDNWFDAPRTINPVWERGGLEPELVQPQSHRMPDLPMKSR